MEIFQGKSVFASIAIGKISIYNKKEQQIKRYRVEDTGSEIAKFNKAKEVAVLQLKDLYEKALKEVGETNAMIFEVHQMMLEDLDYIESITNIIVTQQVNAEYAVAATADNLADMFSSMEDAYMQGRAADVRDISERILDILKGGDAESKYVLNEPVIIVANDLAPSETVQLDKDKLLAFVTLEGSINSHTAILARTMGVPAILKVDMELLDSYNGKLAIVDGYSGTFYIEPDQDILKALTMKQVEEEEKKSLLLELKGKENITLDGHRIKIFANIGNESDLISVLQNDAEGIGLFRSEFLYLEKNDYPTEDEQFAVYKKILETMAGKKVIIRTLDIGADKQIDYFNLEKEENPAMGYRAIRICLDRKHIFKAQLRALYRASAYGTLSIMFPMIISIDEVNEIKKLIDQVKCELESAGIKYSDVEIGIMIETPASVMISDLLAKEVDFFSIGTNDLTQYTLAIDRQNPKLDKLYNAHHPAILRMIELVAKNAHKQGIWVGICGELAADTRMTETFLSMGIDELSVSPAFILGIRKKVRDSDVSKIQL